MASTHIIRQQFVDVEFEGSESDALAVQNRLLRLCQDELSPTLERLFDEFAPPHEHWIIDRMEIDAGSVDPGNLEHLVEAVIEQVDRQLRQWELCARSEAGKIATEWNAKHAAKFESTDSLLPRSVEVRTDTESLLQAFVYFLETGVLPWWFQLPSGKTLEEVIRELWRQGKSPESRPEVFARALGEIIHFANVRQRLAGQFSPDFQRDLLSSVSDEAAAAVRQILAELRKQDITAVTPPGFFEQIWLHAFLSAFSGVRVSPARLVAEALQAMPLELRQRHVLFFEVVAALWPASKNTAARAGTEQPVEQPQSKRQQMKRWADGIPPGLDLGEGVFTSCAGIVLLHPFLPRFFETLGIAHEKTLLQPDRALCLLHHLATGQNFAPEYNLLIAKVLCNAPLDAPVNSHIQLTATEEEESVALLEAMIRHWSALGDTSIENLRGSFLVRPGKLSLRDSEYLLQVEPRSYDVLLDQLPWGMGVVKLPWMQKVLWVEWRF